MAAKKIRDLAVKVSEYQDSQGQTKGRYENIGSMMKGEDGGVFLILKRTFNPAGVINPDNRDSVMVGCFELRDDQQGQQQSRQRQAPHQGQSSGQQSEPASKFPEPVDDFDDDIIF